ncbi:DHA2 family metal-tetracycline-proton antiporter-like MFS transporter [Paenibacillus forsythiae]|uniref:DHA2 family metal-tetracycline-proton antiporter-like MFS transporter n=1 Tax=Paenibacillus forsythiae TaxID=365616 RepID=A0ABU3H8A1_9BACL|nr:MFS transporter [Paenibacillus forsythiae]MDT3427059.1 DHA2 family metal-tetracycline-proton antiporter-like MFS transporter [Paenibacillus forsythiae]
MGAISDIEILETREKAFNEKWIVPFWSLAAMLVVMNTTMFNVALPRVASEFSLTPTVASWIVTAYSIVFGISTITYSRLTDFLPIRKMVLFGALLLVLSSLLGYFAHTFILLMTARIFQAIGAAAFPGLGYVLFSRYIPKERRGSAMSFIASGTSLGFGLGPVVGGALTQYLGWNFLFVMTAAVLFITPIFNRHVPMEETKSVQFDFAGSLLVAASITGLLLFVTTFAPWPLFISLITMGLLWRHINRTRSPFIHPELLRRKGFRQLLSISFTAYFIHFATLFAMPILLAQVFHRSPLEIGLIIFPGAIVTAFASRKIGKIIDRFGNGIVSRWGAGFLLLSVVLFATISSLSIYGVLISYFFMSLGFSSLTASNSNEISQYLPMEYMGAGMGMSQLVGFFGGAFGVGITGMLIALQKGTDMASVFQHIYLGLCLLPLISLYLLGKYDKRTRGLMKSQF